MSWSADTIPAPGSPDWLCCNVPGAVRMAETKLPLARGRTLARLREEIAAAMAADAALSAEGYPDAGNPAWVAAAEAAAAAGWSLVRFAAPLPGQ